MNRKLGIALVMLLVLAMALALGGCASAPPEPTEAPPAPEPTQPPPPEPTPLPDQSMYVAAWEEGAHANNWDLGKGPNTWCSRCHSPQNWDPAAFPGPPPSCMTCKFPTDAELRIAEGNPFVPEEDWVGIPCETCHHVDENGIAGENAWLNPISSEYVEVSTSTELCEKCHVTTTGNAFGSGVEHKITLGGSAHLNYGGFLGEVTPPSYCADCHDPHTLEPKQCVDCHTGIPTSSDHMKGLNAVMLDKLTCMACHDASGLDVGPPPDGEGGPWVTQQTTVGRGGPSTAYVLSHSIVYTVACDRCHFEENAWELTVLTADGEVPAEETTP